MENIDIRLGNMNKRIGDIDEKMGVIVILMRE